jgi:hypothetical protein
VEIPSRSHSRLHIGFRMIRRADPGFRRLGSRCGQCYPGNALAKKVLVIGVSNPIARRDGADTVKWVDDQGGAGLATHRHCEFTELAKYSTHSCLMGLEPHAVLDVIRNAAKAVEKSNAA